jgi:hypothetical protein
LATPLLVLKSGEHTMDPLTTTVMIVLGKYAIDKGAGLIQEAGKAAADVAGKLFAKVMEKLKADPGEAKNAERYEKDPKTFEAPVAAAVAEKIKADPNFAQELQQLVEQFKQAGGASLVASQITATASQGGTAVGAFQVGGNLSGNVQIGGTSTPTNRSGGVDISPSGGTVNITGDVVGRDKKSQKSQ